MECMCTIYAGLMAQEMEINYEQRLKQNRPAEE